MPDFPMLSFAHHVIPLLSLPGAAGVLGCKVHLPTVKAACKSAERIHAVLALAGRFELAVVPDTPDFFDPALVNSQARNQAWETIRETQRLQWVIPTRRPDLIITSLPPTWVGKGFQNVCIGYVADSAVDFAENLQALRSASLQHRMILLSSSSPPIDLSDHLKGIDWVLFTGHSDDAVLAESIESLCRQACAAFLFHQSDGGWENASTIGTSGNGTPWPTHPFGAKIDLSRPTLPDLIPDRTADSKIPISSAPGEECTAPPAALAMKSKDLTSKPDGALEPPAEVLNLEGVASESTQSESAAVESSSLNVGDPDQADFIRLDGVVRRGLTTFIEVGHALAEIRERELWRAGDHPSWAAYCLAVGDLTKIHANRLIKSSKVASRIIKVKPTGFTSYDVIPRSEWQIRPLHRLPDPEKQGVAWYRAVERANGQPTEKLIRDVVAELMADWGVEN